MTDNNTDFDSERAAGPAGADHERDLERRIALSLRTAAQVLGASPMRHASPSPSPSKSAGH